MTLKLLLKFYDPKLGEIFVGDNFASSGLRLSNISHRAWRKQCGVVMQDSFIFSDSIAKNIAVGHDNPNKERLNYASKIANILSKYLYLKLWKTPGFI